MATPRVELIGITKRFGSVVANDDVTLDLRPGEVHSLLGENGAGKTTLMNILYGLYRPNSGRIVLDGQAVSIASPRDAIRLGIGMVHQHFMLVSTLTVAENYGLGQSSLLRRWSAREFEERVRAAGDEVGLPVDPRALVSELAVGQQQRVEIVRALGRGARILILDEPTAVLTPQEAGELMAALRRLAARGTSVVFISHKLNEVMQISDRITVLRYGRRIDTVAAHGTSERELAVMMVGRQELEKVQRGTAAVGGVVAAVRSLDVLDDRGQRAVRELSFDLRSGEILGVAGVAGNGQTELAEALVGLRRPVAGSVLVAGRDMTGRSPGDFIRAGVGYVPEDRQLRGLFATLSVGENLIADQHDWPAFARRGVLQRRAIDLHADQLIKAFDIRPTTRSVAAGTLSGGNRQKVILGRGLARRPGFLVVSQPTRGLDVGATEYIRQRILDERTRGCAILLISADLDELLALSDRVAVIYEGRFIDVRLIGESTIEQIGLLMAGIAPAGIAGAGPRTA
jgi:simple sugar transport system ATP-binding protein